MFPEGPRKCIAVAPPVSLCVCCLGDDRKTAATVERKGVGKRPVCTWDPLETVTDSYQLPQGAGHQTQVLSKNCELSQAHV